MSSKLRVDSILPVDGAPKAGGGGIIQMITGSSTTRLQVPTNTGSYYNTYVNATITPKFNTSKILIVGNGDVQCQVDTTVQLGLLVMLQMLMGMFRLMEHYWVQLPLLVS